MKTLDAFTSAYIEAAFWTEIDDDGDYLDATYSLDDLAPETLAQMIYECERFKSLVPIPEGREGEAGHDFLLTRNAHGAGFWDGDWEDEEQSLMDATCKFTPMHLYIGDDGLIYQTDC